ncbi:MAG: hypothetical protein COV44_11860, partial [Deltaproteobacteria bacterium CG11_big_fil_rev_8_21_14_0_20_45_16]
MQSRSKSYPGINIQFPISQLILSGAKTVETRTYPLPRKYENIEMILIETPGKVGNFKSRAVAKITFGESFQYRSRTDFLRDAQKHKVAQDSPWAWRSKPKWGWPIAAIKPFPNPKMIFGKRGIIFSTQIYVETNVSVAQGRPLTKRQASSAFFERRREGSVGFF